MYTLDLNDYDTGKSEEWAELISFVRSGVKSKNRSTLIRHFSYEENNNLLLRLAKSLGHIYHEPEYPGHPLEDGLVYNVEPRTQAVRDKRNVVLYSTTASHFPCHTDGAGKPNPYDIVILQCVRQDEFGGDSILITLDELCLRLTPAILKTLQEPVFPVPFGKAPIITVTDADMWVRYNGEEIKYYSRLLNIQLTEAQEHALVELEKIIKRSESQSNRFRLMPAECLVIDNKRALHGRTALSDGSTRLLKRLRLYCA